MGTDNRAHSWVVLCPHCGGRYHLSNLMRRGYYEDVHTKACMKRTPEQRERLLVGGYLKRRRR